MNSCKNRCENVNENKIQYEIIKANLFVFKILLSKCFTRDPNYQIVSFDITLINKMKETIFNVSIKDALIALTLIFKNIKFDIGSCSNNLKPLSNNEIMCGDGELLDVKNSTLPPKSVSRLVLKITVEEEFDIFGRKFCADLNILNNSISVNGTVKICRENNTMTDAKIQSIHICSKADY